MMNMVMERGAEIVAPPSCARGDLDLGRALLIAVLLTGNVRQGEASVLETIRCLDPDAVSGGEFLFAVARAAFAASRRTMGEERITLLGFIVPEQLQGVLAMPIELRHCFVLRLLLKVPQRDCADILQIAPRDVNELAAQAASLLAAHQVNRQIRQ